MILALSENCPIFGVASKAHLQNLLYTLSHKRRHILAAPDPDRLRDLIPEDLWLVYGSFLIQALKQAVNSPQKWVSISDCSACNAENLALFCELPTVVIVENAHTDGAWLELIIRKLRPRMVHALVNPSIALDIRTAGGVGEIPKEIERIAERYHKVRPAGTMPLKVIALADSDSKTPGDISAAAHEVIKSAGKARITAHILKKRTIENYIPDDSLFQYSAVRRDRSSAVELIARLAPPARDHYPLKTGLTQEEVTASDTMYPTNIPLGIKLGDFMTDFLETCGHSVDVNALRGRDGIGELETLLDVIEENL